MRRGAVLLALVLCPADVLAQVVDLTPEAIDHIPVERGAVVDWYPGIGNFRISGGVRDSRELDRRGEQRGTVRPYLGLGWQDSVMDGRVLIGLDLGALYQGRPDLRLDEAPALPEAADTPTGARESFPFQPVISVSITYRF